MRFAQRSIAVALAGLFALGAVPAVSAAPLPSSQAPALPADIAAALAAVDSGRAAFVPVQARRNAVIRRGGGAYHGGGAYRGGGGYRAGATYRANGRTVYNPGVYRNGVYHSSNAYRGGNRWAYDTRYHGARYGYRRPGYGYYHGGYWYSNPWWAAGNSGSAALYPWSKRCAASQSCVSRANPAHEFPTIPPEEFNAR